MNEQSTRHLISCHLESTTSSNRPPTAKYFPTVGGKTYLRLLLLWLWFDQSEQSKTTRTFCQDNMPRCSLTHRASITRPRLFPLIYDWLHNITMLRLCHCCINRSRQTLLTTLLPVQPLSINSIIPYT